MQLGALQEAMATAISLLLQKIAPGLLDQLDQDDLEALARGGYRSEERLKAALVSTMIASPALVAPATADLVWRTFHQGAARFTLVRATALSGQ